MELRTKCEDWCCPNSKLKICKVYLNKQLSLVSKSKLILEDMRIVSKIKINNQTCLCPFQNKCN